MLATGPAANFGGRLWNAFCTSSYSIATQSPQLILVVRHAPGKAL
jgi:hypothetical protein